MLKLFKAYTGQVYKQDAKDHCLTDLQKTWVRSMPEIIKKFNTSKGFNRKFSKPVNVSMNDLVNSCFWVFTHFKSEVERLEAWLNVVPYCLWVPVRIRSLALFLSPSLLTK